MRYFGYGLLILVMVAAGLTIGFESGRMLSQTHTTSQVLSSQDQLQEERISTIIPTITKFIVQQEETSGNCPKGYRSYIDSRISFCYPFALSMTKTEGNEDARFSDENETLTIRFGTPSSTELHLCNTKTQIQIASKSAQLIEKRKSTPSGCEDVYQFELTIDDPLLSLPVIIVLTNQEGSYTNTEVFDTIQNSIELFFQQQ